MRVLGNILWHFPFCGFVTAIFVWLYGALLTITVIAAPIGLGLMEFSKFLLAPFSRSMIDGGELNKDPNKAWAVYSTVVRILYFPFGLLAAAVTVLQIAALFVTVIGIPMALILAKALGTYFNPVSKKCVHHAVADEIDRRKAQAEVARVLG